MNPKSKAFKISFNIQLIKRSIHLQMEIDHALIVTVLTIIVKAIISHFLM